MNQTKNLLLILITLISTVSIAEAQRGGGRWNMDPKVSAEKQTTMMKDSLALSDAQTEKIAAVNLLHAEKMAKFRTEARANEDFDRSTMRASMQAMRTEKDADIKKYLTADQFTKWQSIQANQRQKRRGDGSPRGRKGRRGKKGQKDKSSTESN